MKRKTKTKEKPTTSKNHVTEARKKITKEEKKGDKNLPKVKKRVEEKQPLSSEGQVIEAESFQTWPMLKVLDQEQYLGTDTTGVNEITVLYVEEEKKDPAFDDVNEWLKKIDEKKGGGESEINIGIELARMITGDYHRDLHLAAMTAAGRAILLGRILLGLKKLTRKAGHLWTVWADENLSFLTERSRERCMLLASREDGYKYIAFGQERLELLLGATKNVKKEEDPDPIGTLLKKYKIAFSEDSEESPEEFKRRIDAVLASEKLEKNDISLDFKWIKGITDCGVKVDKSLILRLRETKAAGGSEERFMELLTMNRGKVLSTLDSEKRYQDFNTLSTRLVKTLDYLSRDPKQFEKVDSDIYLRLLEKLETHKGMLVLDEVGAA